MRFQMIFKAKYCSDNVYQCVCKLLTCYEMFHVLIQHWDVKTTSNPSFNNLKHTGTSFVKLILSVISFMHIVSKLRDCSRNT
jgi:hypothetical protein